MRHRFLPLVAVLSLLVGNVTLLAADEAPEPVTTENPAIPTDHLALRLEPLTQAELEAEASAWQDLLKAKSQEIAEAEISVRSKPTPEEKEALLETINTLQEEKSALLERFDVVADALEVKGGDTESLRKYAAAVSGIETDVTDVATTWTILTGWLTSKEGGVKWGINILKFIGIMIVFWILARIVRKLVKGILDRTAYMSDLLENFINKMVGRVILAVGFIVALGTVGVNVGAALALIGGGAFVLAFALQDTLGNFANGVMLLIYRPFDVGDAVEVGGVTGKVDSVSLVNTTILTFDNKKVIVPNKSVWGQVITNITGMPNRRVDMTFGIGYDDDIEEAEAIIRKIVEEHELVLKDPEPLIRFRELADSSMNFMVCPWAKTSDYLTVLSDVHKAIKREFDAAGISIPFPQRDVHLYTVNDGNSA